MQKTINEDKSYMLIAEEGKDLAIKDADGNFNNRTKEVFVTAEKTLNVWQEVDELPPVIIDEETIKQKEIAELEAKLAQLKAEVTTV